jgi:hypothetical protein
MLTDTYALKMHVDEGVVWTSRGLGHPTSTHASVDYVLKIIHIAEQETVRIVGTRENAGLILQLADLRTRGELKSLQVVTPLVCSTEADRRRPEAVLYHMRRFHRAPSLGGYHEVTDDDLISYRLIEASKECEDGKLTHKAVCLLYAHPAIRPSRFICGVNMFNYARLLATIVDPRWYVDLCDPDRGSKLEAYLGLNPKTMAGVFGEGPRWRHHDRCKLVVDCWYAKEAAHEVMHTYTEHGIGAAAETTVIGFRPGDFLWRIWGGHMGFDHEWNPVKAVLRASQKFVQLVRLYWLAQLYSNSAVEGGASLFRTTDFFQHLVEAQAFDTTF